MSDLASRLDQFVGRPVLCVGDLMLDRYVYGQVERISPEAPIPVLHTQRETATLGGAGNVVRNIAALGGRVEVIGVIGQDKTGGDVAREFEALENVNAHLQPDFARPTTEKTRYVANGQQLLRADYENSKAVSPEIEQKILHTVGHLVAQCKVTILSDYAKGVLTPKVVTESIRLARAAGNIVIVDPKNRDFGRYRGADYLTPNRKELSDAVGKKITNVEEAEEAARGLMKEFGIHNMLVKLGADGVCLVRTNHPALHLHTKAREVFDVSGAGDTVAATLALALASGFDAAEAAELANTAGSIVVGKVGTAFVSRDEIAHELRHNASQKSEDKIVRVETMSEIAEKWRKQGLKVGFTNGFFDLLHPGHISLIRQARAACDKLVVAMNSDAAITRLLGAGRPIQNEAARCTVMASLADVDHVVVFGEDNPLTAIKSIRPDILVKGSNHAADDIIGAKEVESWGGKVVLATLVEGHSTSETIKKIKQ